MNKKSKLIFLFLIISSTISFSQSTNFDSLLIQYDSLKKGMITDSKDKEIFNLLENLCSESLQDETGELKKKTIKKHTQLTNNQKLKNRSILFLFNAYQKHISETSSKGIKSDAQYQEKIINLLSFECISIYNKIPEIVYIYMGESMMNNNDIENAIQHFNLALEFYPKSIPMKIYKYLLDKDNNTSLKRELVKKHSKHWMVKLKLLS